MTLRRRLPTAKRALDILASTLGLVALAPVFLMVAFLVRMHLGSPVLFRQRRPGLGGEPFELIKFRTMKSSHGPDGYLLPDAQRLTPFGRLLRSTSLDELPELLNVLYGHMSLVGPRPLLMEYLPLYTQFQVRRHEVRPGITGLAQVNGRAALNWEERFRLDVWYVDNWTMWLDCKILLKTLLIIVRREGVSSEGLPLLPGFEPARQR